MAVQPDADLIRCILTHNILSPGKAGAEGLCFLRFPFGNGRVFPSLSEEYVYEICFFKNKNMLFIC